MWQTWSDYLASLAVTWAAGCRWEHGQPPLGSSPPYTSLGQNLYAVTGGNINLTAAVQAWYDEKTDYYYDTLGCAYGKMCGHYTQVQPLSSLIIISIVVIIVIITNIDIAPVSVVISRGTRGNAVSIVVKRLERTATGLIPLLKYRRTHSAEAEFSSGLNKSTQ